jgi:hypothetical protein
VRASLLKRNVMFLCLLLAGCGESLSPEVQNDRKYEIKFASANARGSWKAVLIDGTMDRSEFVMVGREACADEKRMCDVQIWKDPLFVPSSENPSSQSQSKRLAKYWRAEPGIISEKDAIEEISYNCQHYRDIPQNQCSGGTSDYDIAFDECIATPRAKQQSDKEFMESCQVKAKQGLSPAMLKTLGIE